MQGEQTILRGFQGTGKRSFMIQLKTPKLKFHEQNPSDIIIGLKEEIAYATLREEIIPRIDSKGKSETYKFRFVWEFYILYRICSKIQGDPTLPQKAKRIVFIRSLYTRNRRFRKELLYDLNWQ